LLIYDITVAFGKDSLFAEALDDRFWGVVDVPPAAWVAMPDLDRPALPSGGDLACRMDTDIIFKDDFDDYDINAAHGLV
jgi:hypothetical protein